MAIVHLITGDWQAYHEIQYTPNQSGQIMLIQTEWWLGIRWWMIPRKTHQERLFHKWPWRQKQWTVPRSLITSPPSSSSPTPVIYHHSHDWLFYRFCFWLAWRILGYVTSGISEKCPSQAPRTQEVMISQQSKKPKHILFTVLVQKQLVKPFIGGFIEDFFNSYSYMLRKNGINPLLK